MGYYINPKGMSKEEWLHDNAMPLAVPPDKHIEIDGWITVVLVDNGLFTALAVAYSQEELEAFKAPDPRPMTWWWAEMDAVAKEVGVVWL